MLRFVDVASLCSVPYLSGSSLAGTLLNVRDGLSELLVRV